MNPRKKNDEVYEIDILELFSILLRNAKFIILCALIGAVIAYAATLFLVTPMYKATATFYVNNNAGKDSSSAITNADLTASAKLVDTYAAIIKSDSVLDRVITAAGVDMTSEQLKGRITAKAVNNTEVFNVSATHADPKTAARIVNAIADIAPMQITGIVEGSSVKIVDYPKIPTKINSPNYKKNAAIGLLAGLLLSVAYVLIRALSDNSIKSAQDFEIWGFPILASIPDIESSKDSGSYGYGYAGAKNRAKSKGVAANAN